jgi:membrane-associated phospholipid phosphatase
MKHLSAVVLVCLAVAAPVAGQTPAAIGSPATLGESRPGLVQPASVETTSPQASFPAIRPGDGAFLAPLGQDFTRFFSTDTAKVVGAFALAALLAHPADRQSVDTVSANLTKGIAHTGNTGGSLLAQLGGGLATYAVGRATGQREVATIGGELVRAQILTQGAVQGAKFLVRRERPDGSNRLSFPSGHTASAFATATIVQQHYGWKAGVPAYALAGAVSASRMASNKHYLSDVLMGAGIGIAAGRAVTFKLGREKFALGAAPTDGGAMVTFTKR